jgi:hypothetical protein
MTVPNAVVVGAAIVGVAILTTRMIAPYQISSAGTSESGPFVWRLNTLTGAVTICRRVTPPSYDCSGIP